MFNPTDFMRMTTEKYASDKSFVPNDTYATEAASFQLLTGVSYLHPTPAVSS